MLLVEDEVEVVDTVPTYVIEKAKSARSECKKCDEKIAKGCIRVGLMVEGQWGLFTRWQHLECTVFHKNLSSKDIELIDGFADLEKEDKV